MQPTETSRETSAAPDADASQSAANWAEVDNPQGWTLVSGDQATSGGDQQSPGESQPIEVALPPLDGITGRETRPGQSGSASEAGNEADAPSPTPGVAYGAANPPLNDGTGEPRPYRDGSQQPNSAGSSTESPAETPPLTATPEGGSQSGGALNSLKEDDSVASGQSQDRPGYDEDGNPLPGADGTVSMDDWIHLNDQDGDGQVDSNLVDLSGTAVATDQQTAAWQNPLEALLRDAAESSRERYEEARDLQQILRGTVPGQNGGGFSPDPGPGVTVPQTSQNPGALPGTQRPSDGPKGPQDRAEQRANAESGPPPASGDPIPVANAGGSPLESRLTNGPAIEVERVNPGDLLPGERNAVPDVDYETEGVGLRGPVVGHGNGLHHADDGEDQPGGGGIRGRLDPDGDGRPDVGLPGMGRAEPGYEPPQRGPGITIPEDLGPRTPGPEFEPGIEQPVPPPAGHEQPRADHGSPPEPSNPGGGAGNEPPARYESPPPPAQTAEPHPSAPNSGSAPVEAAVGTGPTGASLDVFTANDEVGSPTSPATDIDGAPGEATPSETGPSGGDLAPSWTLTSAAAITLFQGESVPAVDTSDATANEHGDFFPLTDFLASLNLTAEASGPYPSDVGSDDPNFLERIIDMIRDALFLSEESVPDVELATQLSALGPTALLELERHLMEQDSDDQEDQTGLDG